MRSLFLIITLVWIQSFPADLKSFESEVKNCKANQLDKLLVDVSKAVSEKMSPLSDSEREKYFYKNTFESDLVTRFGSSFLSEKTRLSLGAKACGYYMDKYVESIQKEEKKEEFFKTWISCFENDYKDDMPKIVKTIIECSKK